MSIHPLIQRVLWEADTNDALKSAEEFVELALAQRDGEDGSIRLHDLLLNYVRGQFPDRAALAVIHEAIRLSSPVIDRDPRQFASQLVGRLLPYVGMPAVRGFAETMLRAAPRPWLRPLKRALRPPGTGLLRTLRGHGDSDLLGSTLDVSITSDGRRAVSVSSEALKVWDLESGRELRTLEGDFKGVALTAYGWRAVSSSDAGTLTVWDLETGCQLSTLEGYDADGPVAVTPEGRRAVSATLHWTLKVWHLESGRELRTLEALASRVLDVAVTADGRRAVSASYDKTLKVWELESGRELRTLDGHSGRVVSVAVMLDARRAVSASLDWTLKVWDLETGASIATFSCDASVWSCGIAQDTTIVVGDDTGRVHLSST